MSFDKGRNIKLSHLMHLLECRLAPLVRILYVFVFIFFVEYNKLKVLIMLQNYSVMLVSKMYSEQVLIRYERF